MIRRLKKSLFVSGVLFAVGVHSAVGAPQVIGAPDNQQQKAKVNVLTYRYENTRTGWNQRETYLSPATVRPDKFGKQWNRELDGFVDGAPLFVSNLNVNGQMQDVVFATTDHNSVWALNADSGEVLWSRPELAPPVSDVEYGGGWGRNLHGILSTPVIDAKRGVIYVCGIRSYGWRQQFLVWALDLSTGKTRSGWPIIIDGTYKGRKFNAGGAGQRSALTLQGDWLYIPFAGRGDIPPWRGWLFALDTRNPKQPPRAFCTSPRTDGAGLWNASGVTMDGTGAIYAVAGNGNNDLTRGGDNLGQTVMRLQPRNNGFYFSRQPRDYFLPSNYHLLDARDEGLGSAAAIVLPRQIGTSTPNLLFTGGKDGFVYLLNRDNLGGVDGQLQSAAIFNKPTPAYHEGIRSTPAYFDGGDTGRWLFVAGDEPGPHGQLSMVAFSLEPKFPGGPMQVRPRWSLKRFLQRPTSPVVSSNGPNNGIVWLVEWRGDGDDNVSALRAYDALSGHELYSSDMGPESDRLKGARRFVGPTVANGRVYVGANGVFCYGSVQRVAQTTPTPAAAPPAPTPMPVMANAVSGTILSVRGNILVVKPELRLLHTRVAFGPKTEVTFYRRTNPSVLRIGQRVEMGGPVVPNGDWTLNFLVATSSKIPSFEKRTNGIETSPDGNWRSGKGTIRSLNPLVIVDDASKEWRPSLERLRGVWELKKGGRETLLIGTRIFATGELAPDGVLAATQISPDRHYSQEGTMFGSVASTQGRTLTIHPRFTRDRIKAQLSPKATLLREVPVDPQTLRIGDTVTIWAEKRPQRRNRPLTAEEKSQVKAYAVLLGSGRYPSSTDEDGPRYYTGKITSIFPPRLQLADGQNLRILATGQMPIARLVPVQLKDFVPGTPALFVLAHAPQGGFIASTVIINAAPWVGYGN